MRKFVNSTLGVLAAAMLLGPSVPGSVVTQAPAKPDIIAAEQQRSTSFVPSRSFTRSNNCPPDECPRPTAVKPPPEPPKSCTKIKNSIWKGPCPPQPPIAELKRIAREVLAERGWNTDEQWNCLDQLVYKESSWNPYSENSIHAYGLAQSMPGDKMATVGADWGYNPRTQLRWMMKYIAGVARYRTPCGAWAKWQVQRDSNGYPWY